MGCYLQRAWSPCWETWKALASPPKAIKKDIAAEKADWAAKNFFKAGEDIADAVTLAVGPIESAEDDYLATIWEYFIDSSILNVHNQYFTSKLYN